MDALYCNCHACCYYYYCLYYCCCYYYYYYWKTVTKIEERNGIISPAPQVSIINKRTEIPLIGGGGYVDTLNKVIRFPLYLGYTSIVHLRISQYTDRRDEIERKL